jgi:hypothetical protein
MLSWLVDHAVLLYVLFGCVAVAFAAGWWLTRKRPHLIGLAIALALIALVWLLSLLILTDRQQIERNIREMAQGVTDKKPESVAKHLSSNFSYGRVTRATAAKEIGDVIQRQQLGAIEVLGVDFEDVSRNEGKATVNFRVRVEFTTGQYPFRCHSHFVIEDGQWRMKDFELRNFATDEPIPVPLP